MTKLEFPVGNYKLHKEANFNYQLNRIHAIGGNLEEIEKIAAKVTDIPSFVFLMKEAADKAKAEGRLKEAVAYLRGQEFFTTAAQGKAAVYEEYKELFYQVNADLLKESNVQRAEVPYENGFLPVLYCVNPNPKGVIVIHGGFDSYLEEHLQIMIYMCQNGYSAYIFEGPGQGEVIHRYGIPFTPEWHKPVGAVLDYFNLADVALMGISFGTGLCRSAAAREKRIKYVCAIGFGTDLFKGQFSRMPKDFAEKLIGLIDQGKADEVNEVMCGLMKKSPNYSWMIEQGLNIFGVATPYDYLCEAKKYSLASIADQVTQDYLVIAGQNDHSAPVWLGHDEIDLMKNVRSFTMRIITAIEKGDDHCNVSNRKLMLDIVLNWLEETKKHITGTEN
jgi:hypothetical protein